MKNKINKIAYPQGYSNVYTESYDLNKWMKTFNQISLYAKQGYEFSKVSDQLTQNWDSMEKQDFAHWMKYYQSNSQNAYKKAQFIEVGHGAYLPNKPVQVDELKPNIKFPEEDDPQFKINKKIQSIIRRLSSAEKIATDPDIQRELSRRLDVSLHKWLEELHRLKRLVQVAPIKNANSSILEDLIIKEANILASKGFPKAAEELIKIAEAGSPKLPAPNLPTPSKGGPKPTPGPSLPPIGAAPPGADLPPIGADLPKPGAPALPGGKPLPKPSGPAPAPGPLPAPAGAKPKAPGEENLEEFVKNLNLGKGNNNKDNNQIVDPLDDDLFGITIQADDSDELAEIEVFAQALPEAIPAANLNAPAPGPGTATVSDLASISPMATNPSAKPIARAPQLTPEIEVSDDTGSEFAETKLHKRTDDLLESALSSITVVDVIERLDTLVNLFRTREIPRQLAIIDLMMDQLNLSSFFPGLAEASSKSLESNQYALSRIEEVLSKLKGSIKNPKAEELDLLGGAPSTSPEAMSLQGIKSNLQSQEDKEKARKQQKKQEELSKLEEVVPEIEVEEDLSQPVALPQAQPATPPQAPTLTRAI